MKRIILSLALALTLAACSAIAPTYKKTVAASGATATTFSAGQYALVDRLPGDDQQHETTAVTGLSARDMSIGVLMRDVTRNPVSEKPLHAAGFRRVESIDTAIGDSIDADITSGEAFLEELQGEAPE